MLEDRLISKTLAFEAKKLSIRAGEEIKEGSDRFVGFIPVLVVFVIYSRQTLPIDPSVEGSAQP